MIKEKIYTGKYFTAFNEKDFEERDLSHDFDKLLPFLSRLNELARLSDGWAGAGTHAPGRVRLTHVITLLFLLPQEVLSRLDDEDILPTPSGSIVLDWHNESGDHFTLQIGQQSANYFLRQQNTARQEENLIIDEMYSWKNSIILMIKQLYAHS